MRPRWCRKGELIDCDEIGAIRLPAPATGWYLIINHYGRVYVHRLPGFWAGLAMWWRKRRPDAR
jgi:hypothetical protein